jgi:hypothetical protein
MSILPSEARDYFDVPNHRASNSLPNLIDEDAKGGSNVASRKRKKMDNGMPTPLWPQNGQTFLYLQSPLMFSEFARPVKRIFRDGRWYFLTPSRFFIELT